MLKTLKVAIILLVLTSASAKALPYTPFPQEYKWLGNHSFFPSDHIFGGGSTMAFSALNENQVLGIQIGYTVNFDSEPDQNKVRVETEEIAVLNNCNEITPFGLLQNLNLKDGDCQFSEAFAPLSLNHPQLQKVIHLVYGPLAPRLIKDLQSAKLTFQGKRRFFMDKGNREFISGGPIAYQFFQGAQFDYVLTPFALLVSIKKGKYTQNLVNEIRIDEKQHASVSED